MSSACVAEPIGLPSSRRFLQDSAAEPDSGADHLGAHLHRLRWLRGFSLRRVEALASELGGTIDNSRLSRVEKGRESPTLRILICLGRIYQVPVQYFSEIADVEPFDPSGDAAESYDGLMESGLELYRISRPRRALRDFACARNIAQESDGVAPAGERTIRAGLWVARTLRFMGRLTAAEYELRWLLRRVRGADPHIRVAYLRELSSILKDSGNVHTASLLAREALQLAERQGEHLSRYCLHNNLGNLLLDTGSPADCIRHYSRAIALAPRLDVSAEVRLNVHANLGLCLTSLGRVDDSIRRFRRLAAAAEKHDCPRLNARCFLHLGEALMRRDDARRAAEYLDRAAHLAGEDHKDILFCARFHQWTLARRTGNPVRERLCFGRLRRLRPFQKWWFPEVEAFDHHLRMNPERADCSRGDGPVQA